MPGSLECASGKCLSKPKDEVVGIRGDGELCSSYSMTQAPAGTIALRRSVSLLSLRSFERPERAGRVHHLAADHRHQRLDAANLIDWNGKVILREHGQVGEPPDFERAALVLIE